MVARQRLRIGRAYAGKTITVIAADTSFRVLDGDRELTSFARDPTKPLTPLQSLVASADVDHVLTTIRQPRPDTAHITVAATAPPPPPRPGRWLVASA